MAIPDCRRDSPIQRFRRRLLWRGLPRGRVGRQHRRQDAHAELHLVDAPRAVDAVQVPEIGLAVKEGRRRSDTRNRQTTKLRLARSRPEQGKETRGQWPNKLTCGDKDGGIPYSPASVFICSGLGINDVKGLMPVLL